MKSLQKISLYISNVQASLDFYANRLGMKLVHDFSHEGKECYHFKYNEDTAEATLELIYDSANQQTIYPKQQEHLTGYWKVAISIQDVDIAREKLLAKGVEVSVPFQVPDVAYLCHLQDPDGYIIELIQHRFMHNHIVEQVNDSYPLGNKAVLSLVTYRVKDIAKSLEFYEKQLGLRLLAKMDVHARGFELYFLGYSREMLPHNDIGAIENREWLWQRSFTMIELQYKLDLAKEENFQYEVGISTGFKGLSIQSKIGKSFADPDGYEILIES